MVLEKEFLQSFFSLTYSFFLTGGNALNLFYFQHRLSDDLDCFTQDRREFDDLNALVSESCFKISAQHKEVRSFHDYKRYLISRGEEAIITDFVFEPVPQLYPSKNIFQGIRVDVPEEIVVNKLCALLGRSEFKDLIDLYYLEKNGYPAMKFVTAASQKDGGFNAASLAYVLDRIDLARMPEALKSIVPADELESFRTHLKNALLKASFPTA
ncbi:MAG: hypothetical protein A2293_15805 [Elusimicrobia bacterium RIFOXYB2_FULL_49_7]|nr:MAG: hypothetical protein A2293_15805 [Elusimicrobia bacterium RIFOXYB2_FULL_49_7]